MAGWSLLRRKGRSDADAGVADRPAEQSDGPDVRVLGHDTGSVSLPPEPEADRDGPVSRMPAELRYCERSERSGIRLIRRAVSWRPSVLLAGLLLAAMTLMLIDVAGGPTRHLRSGGQAVVGGLQVWATAAVGPVTGLPIRRGDAAGLQRSIADLQDENSRLAMANSRLTEQLRDSEQVAAVRRWSGAADLTVVPSHVVARSFAPVPGGSVTIAASRHDGITTDMAVVADGGLVGRVVEVGPSSSTVRLITSPAAGIGARDTRSGARAAVTGTGRTLRVDRFGSHADLAEGDELVTLGSVGGKPYPAGIPIGTVTDVRGTVGQPDRWTLAEPVADLSRLDVIGVVVGQAAS